MKLIFLMFLWFPTTVLLAENNDTVIQAQIQELKTQNEHLKKDLEVATKKFELLESKITYKSETLDDLAKQIKINEENFNKTFDLYYWISIIIGGAVVIIATGMGLWRNGKLTDMKEEIDEHKKMLQENLKLHLENFNLAERKRATAFEDSQNKISQLYKKIENDTNVLLKPLEEKLSFFEYRMLNYEKEHNPKQSSQPKTTSTLPNDDTQPSKKSATDLLE